MVEHQARDFFYQMLKAVEKCHEFKIVHRNVSMENFLIDIDQSDHNRVHIRLAGFSHATSFMFKSELSDKVGYVTSMAPEMLKGLRVDYKVDSWGLGVILFELLTSNMPFQALSAHKIEE